MRKFCLIGHPLGHSLSPKIHTRLFELEGEKVDYSLCDIAPEELSSKYSFFDGLSGFNITIPHKMAIIDYCDELDASAKRYNSVNCIKNDGRKIGYNTDCIGFTKSIEMLGASLKSKVLLIGCGGVGRMIAIETALEGGNLTIAVLPSDMPLAEKTVSEIRQLAPESEVNIITIDNTALAQAGDFDLLVNASPVGMFPKTDAMPCSEKLLEHIGYVFDVIYNPRETLLCRTAREKGAKTMNGMAMLVLQAVAAHEIWDKASYNEADIRKLIEDMEKLV